MEKSTMTAMTSRWAWITTSRTRLNSIAYTSISEMPARPLGTHHTSIVDLHYM